MAHKTGILHRFYLVEPTQNASADELAERLISLKPVQEIFLTDYDCGFLVKARFFKGMEPDNTLKYIAKNVSRKFGKVVDCFQHKK